ncbi:glycosyltransferase [Leptolyngbya sp. NIES-2104]|uniref:glycosyltransferase n=1 Tax=Leptolyngbya sp. NIES-2104 TaxID=1552121 RepID=UPI0006EC882D|nr:glycosyltransferase [Leptolyngbya sp. NIES-2104]GAP94522.1 glycosyl transferase, family 2 [Leptolyngbya sp. NIES-2104]
MRRERLSSFSDAIAICPHESCIVIEMKKLWNPIETWTQRKSHSQTHRNSSHQAGRAIPTPRLNSIAQVSIVLPVYNEQACIRRTFEAVLRYLETHPNFTFIFVNDGSSDRTKEIITAGIHLAKTPQIRLISYHPRAGKGYAIRRGVEYAEGDLICFLDSDLAYSLAHLDLLVEKLQTCDVAIGNRSLVRGNQKKVRHGQKVAEKIFNVLPRRMLDLQYSDMQAGLKGFRKSAAKKLFFYQTLTGFSFDVELIYLAQNWGYSIAEIPAKVSEKHQKKRSKVNLIQDSIKMLLDLLKIRFNEQLGRYQ